jgi:pimeloyl-ACP methyl ester carboxylesterase
MRERDVQFMSGSVPIAGTIATPDSGDRFPGALLIPGSGQVDRDENHKKLRLNVFKEMSAYLAGNGIATLRYDKRGVGASGGNYWETGMYDNVAVAVSGLNFMKTQPYFNGNKIFLIGHSEGAFISVKVAADGAAVAGVVLLAGAAHSGEDVMKWQAIQVARGMKGFNAFLIKLLRIDVSKSQQKMLNRLKDSTKDYMRVQLFARLNAKWFREFLAYNPADDLPKIKVPVLAVTGEKDIQVDANDLNLMAEIVRAPFEYHILPDVTHLLRPSAGEPSISDYKKLVKEPLDPRILELILAWLRAH